MAAKPTSRPRWANAGGVIVEPSAGKKDIGWVSGEPPPAEFANWLHNLAWQWTEYLGDGALSGDHSITGGGLSVEDDVVVGAQLVVGGDAIFNGTNVEVNGTAQFQGDPVFFADSIDVNGDVRGTGRICHGNRPHYIPAAAGIIGPGDNQWLWLAVAPGASRAPAWNGVTATGGAVVTFPVPLEGGDRLLAVRGYVRHATGGTIRMALLRSLFNSPPVTIGGIITTSGFTGNQVLSTPDISEQANVPGIVYHVIFQLMSDGTDDDQIFAVEVDWEHPPP